MTVNSPQKSKSSTSIFDIAGPIMVGPSSSHTAGACKIGQFARALFHHTPWKVTFYLHGSFAEVYKGHATDRALLAGVLKCQTSDPRIKNSFELAEEKGLKYEFKSKDLGENCHPNTVKIVLENDKHKMSVTGSSIGGGMIEIVKINNFDVLIKGQAGKYLSLIISHDKSLNIEKEIIPKLKKLDNEVANIESTVLKNKVLSVLSIEGRRITLPEVKELEKTPGVEFIRALTKLDK